MNKTKIYTTKLDGDYKSKIEGIIKVKYRDDIKLNICKIAYEYHENGEYQYIFEPFYDVIDALPSSIYQGIPGLNLNKRKKYYYRVNTIPAFIKERTMGKDRENLQEELNKVCMDEYNPLEWLIRTDTEYSGDNLIVERCRLPKDLSKINFEDLMYGDVLSHLEELDDDVQVRANQLLMLLGSGVIIEDENLKINAINRSGALQLLINQYDTSNKQALPNNNDNQKLDEGKGKKKKSGIDDFVMEEIIKELELNIISEMEAMELMDVNTKTILYKKIKDYKAKKK